MKYNHRVMKSKIFIKNSNLLLLLICLFLISFLENKTYFINGRKLPGNLTITPIISITNNKTISKNSTSKGKKY